MIETCTLAIDAQSHIGLVRKRNEDAGVVGTAVVRDNELRTDVALASLASVFVVAVADGMGGHKGGDVASMRVATSLIEASRDWPVDMDAIALGNALTQTLEQAHAELLAMSDADSAVRDLGATCTAIAFSRVAAVLAHAGDSRCYRLRDGILSLQSRDHTAVEAAGGGRARTVLTNSIGGGPSVHVDITDLTRRVLVGDEYLLCSDGAADASVPDEDVVRVLSAGTGVAAVVDAALARGGRDNITAIRITVTDGGAR
jgi:serine/threonine protein phosphatase PrpC